MIGRPLKVFLLIVPAIAWLILALIIGIGREHIDMSALFIAGYLVNNGSPDLIYTVGERVFGPTPQLWQEALVNSGYESLRFVAYLYPPVWAWIVAPLAQLPLQTFYNATLLFQCATMLGAVVLAWHLAPRGTLAGWAWSMIAFILLSTTIFGLSAIKLNQLQITVTFLIVWSMVSAQRGQEGRAGALLALAVALKVTPLFFVLVLIGARQWRACLWFAIVGGGLGLASLAIAGWPLHWQFLQRLSMLNDLTAISAINHSLEPLLMELHLWLSGLPIPDTRLGFVYTMAEPVWVQLATKSVLLLGILALFRTQKSIPARFLGFAILTSLAGPFAWAHYYLVPVMALPALFHIMPRWTAGLWILMIGTACNFFVYMAIHAYNHIFVATAVVTVITFGALFIAILLSKTNPPPLATPATASDS